MEENTSSLDRIVVTIVGLGLMGGSLAMALRGKVGKLIGVDVDEDAVSFALQEKLIDQASADPFEFLKETDLMILALPVNGIISILSRLRDYQGGNVVVLDVGSIKQEIVNRMNVLPASYNAVGGHPICGKETSTIYSASGDLYRDSIFVLTETDRTTIQARSIVEQLVLGIGSIPLWMDASHHDRLVAATSHLPYVISNSMARLITGEELEIPGPGLRSVTRLAGSQVNMMMDILALNKANILDSIDEHQHLVEEFRSALQADDEAHLRSLLGEGVEQYKKIF